MKVRKAWLLALLPGETTSTRATIRSPLTWRITSRLRRET
jgi:hypothetical protein